MTIKTFNSLPRTSETIRDWLSEGLRRYALSPHPLVSYFDNVEDDLPRRPFEQIHALVESGKLLPNPLREAARVLLSGLERGSGPFGSMIGQLAHIAANLGDKELPQRLRPHLINGELMPGDNGIKAAPALFTATEALFKLLPDGRTQRLLKEVTLEPGCPAGLFCSIYIALIRTDAERWVSYFANWIADPRFAKLSQDAQQSQIRNALEEVGHARFAGDAVALVDRILGVSGEYADLVMNSAFEGDGIFRSVVHRTPISSVNPKMALDLFYRMEAQSIFYVARKSDLSADHLAQIIMREKMPHASRLVTDFLVAGRLAAEVGNLWHSSTKFSRADDLIRHFKENEPDPNERLQ